MKMMLKRTGQTVLSMMQSGLNESIYKWALFSQIHFGVQWLKRLRGISGVCYADLDLTDDKNYVLKLAGK